MLKPVFYVHQHRDNPENIIISVVEVSGGAQGTQSYVFVKKTEKSKARESDDQNIRRVERALKDMLASGAATGTMAIAEGQAVVIANGTALDIIKKLEENDILSKGDMVKQGLPAQSFPRGQDGNAPPGRFRQ